MILCGNGVLCWQAWPVLLCLVDVAFAGYELDDQTRNWTSAVKKFTGKNELPLANITSIGELCEAQAETHMHFSYGYWTALKLNSMGFYQWGHLANNTTNVTKKLLDRTEPVDRCYVISKSAMKLLSKDCESLQGVLLSYPNGDKGSDNSINEELLEHYSDECIEYELSKCSKLVNSTKQELPQPWSCKKSNGMSYGSYQVEEVLLNCCRTYCQAGNKTYSVDTASDIETKVRKVPKGYRKDVEISFNTSGNNEENKEVKVIITSQVFNHTERVVSVLLRRTTGDQEFKLTNTGNFVLYSDVVGVVLEPNHTDIIPNKVIIHLSHNKPTANREILERKCIFWKDDINSWSSEGCTVLNNSSPERTICGCNHLTNFAVLMRLKEEELLKCLKLVDFTKKELSQPWSCKKSNGMSYGSCQVEEAILNCCRTYCRAGNHTYSVDTASRIKTKVRKVPKGYSKDVEISFNRSCNNEENKEGKVIITSQVFNHAERVVAVLLHCTTGDQEFKLTNTSSFVLYSDVVGVVLEPNHTEIIPNKVIVHFSHKKPSQEILERKCVFWEEDLK